MPLDRKANVFAAVKIRLTVPTSNGIVGTSHARVMATRDEEQAVSIHVETPVRPIANERRPLSTLDAPPVPEKARK